MNLTHYSNRFDPSLLAVAIVTILSGVDERSGSFTDDNGKDRDYTVRSQKARLEVGGFAYPYKVRLDKDQAPYALGVYVLDLAGMVLVNKEAVNLSKFPVLLALTPEKAKA